MVRLYVNVQFQVKPLSAGTSSSQTKKKNSQKLLQLTPLMYVPNLLILAKSKKFTLAVPSNVRFVISAEF